MNTFRLLLQRHTFTVTAQLGDGDRGKNLNGELKSECPWSADWRGKKKESEKERESEDGLPG